jgi:hypothetical protein
MTDAHPPNQRPLGRTESLASEQRPMAPRGRPPGVRRSDSQLPRGRSSGRRATGRQIDWVQSYLHVHG